MTKLVSLGLALALCGCSTTVYKVREVLVPIACIDEMPAKVALTSDNVANVIALQKAYLDMRLILSKCTRSKNEKN